MTIPQGVLPSPAIRDSRSTGIFIFGQLDPALDGPGVQRWLTSITEYLASLRSLPEGQLLFDAAVGFGPSFFVANGQPRFGITSAPPAGFSVPPTLPVPFPFPPDFVIYAMSPEEEILVQLVRWVASSGPPVIKIAIERGFQRSSHRENFGFLDGLRNPGLSNRSTIALVGLDQMGDEPAWVEGAAYMAYMKISQEVAQAATFNDDAMEQVIGRRKDDGSRLDQQPGLNPMDEPDYANPSTPGVGSHVRKVGPRGLEQSPAVEIFRRGLPYMEPAPDGSIDFGLHFVSFGDLDVFNTIFTRWMSNPVFPVVGTNPDALLQLIVVKFGAFFIVPPEDPRFIGAQIFDPEPTPAPATSGRVVVKKRVADSAGNPLPQRSLRGAVFQVLLNNAQVGDTFTTDAAGRAVSGDLSSQPRVHTARAHPARRCHPGDRPDLHPREAAARPYRGQRLPPTADWLQHVTAAAGCPIRLTEARRVTRKAR